MANMGPTGIIRYEETFANDNINTSQANGIGWLTLVDATGTDFVRAVAAGKGLHCLGVNSANDDALVEFCGDTLMFAAQEGHCAVEILVQFSTVATMAFNFGFNDDSLDASNTLPCELNGTTWTSNAATFVGFVYDTDATNDNLHCFWVDGDSDTTTAVADLRMVGMAPTAAKWLYLRVELQDRGSGNGARATFLAVDHTGKSVEKVFDTSITRSTPLCFYFGQEERAALGRNVFIKAPAWEQSIANM